jgi:enoyl-CoA hydratase/3-hydroxyacyl-CoA dehydrogenase
MSLGVKATLSNLLLQVPGIAELGLKPRKIQKVAVVGGGLMGSGIVTACILSGYSVLLKEINDKFLQMGLGRVRGNFLCNRLLCNALL